MELMYLCVIFIWVIAGIYIYPHYKKIQEVYELDEHFYLMDIQSSKMNLILDNKVITDDMMEEQPSFNDYQWNAIDEQNVHIRNICIVGVIVSIIYSALIYGVINICQKFV